MLPDKTNPREKTLFIGNGLNRCLDIGINWGDLLNDIASTLGVSYNDKIDMPLEFERIVNEYLKRNNTGSGRKDNSATYLNIKKNVASSLSVNGTLGNCVHKNIPFNIVRNIITSNYDTILEQAYDELNRVPFIEPQPNNRIKYLVTSVYDDENIAFYHPHGIRTCANSICLGYEHYMGLVELIRGKSNQKVKNIGNKRLSPPYSMRIHRILDQRDPKTNESWEKFYTSDLAFVGFGLPACESDIWWLLTHRASVYYSNYMQCGDLIKNHIIYYDIIDAYQDEINENYNRYLSPKHILLKDLHVEVRLIGRRKHEEESNSYENAYNAILSELKDPNNWRPGPRF